MSMSTHVTGFAPPDETWQKMKAIWDACETVGVPVPGEVEEFFGGEGPDPAGGEVGPPRQALGGACETAGVPVPGEVEEFFGGEAPDPAGVEVDLPLREWSDSGYGGAGYELDIAAIPPQVKTIRFYNSW